MGERGISDLLRTGREGENRLHAFSLCNTTPWEASRKNDLYFHVAERSVLFFLPLEPTRKGIILLLFLSTFFFIVFFLFFFSLFFVLLFLLFSCCSTFILLYFLSNIPFLSLFLLFLLFFLILEKKA